MIICNLLRLMDERGVTISDISRDTGITRPTLSSLRNGKSEGIQFKTIDTLCKYFDVSVEKLIIFYKE